MTPDQAAQLLADLGELKSGILGVEVVLLVIFGVLLALIWAVSWGK